MTEALDHIIHLIHVLVSQPCPHHSIWHRRRGGDVAEFLFGPRTRNPVLQMGLIRYQCAWATCAPAIVPYGVSEWDLSGLTPICDCKTVSAARVKGSVFSIEGRLESVRDFYSRQSPGKRSGSLELIEGTNFWIREDALDDDGVGVNIS